jgi:hypothetical protein
MLKWSVGRNNSGTQGDRASFPEERPSDYVLFKFLFKLHSLLKTEAEDKRYFWLNEFFGSLSKVAQLACIFT